MLRNIMIALSILGLFSGATICTGTYSRAAAQSPAAARPQSEATLRAVIDSLMRADPDLSQMEPVLQQAMRQQMPMASAHLKQLGALKNLTFLGKQNGSDVYKAEFQNGTTMWAISMLENGKIAGLTFRPM
jgi:hypothetical protein